MSRNEKIEKLKKLTNEHDESILRTFLDIAGSAIINKAYPFIAEARDVPPRYEPLQINIAVYLLDKRGAEGETYHSENGINRAYESANIPNSMLDEVTPFGGVIC